MLDKYARNFFTALFAPLAEFLVARGISPNVVTVIGTGGAVSAALICFPAGWLFWGVVFVTIFIFSDLIDGIMARMIQPEATPTPVALWGAFLDSTLDRIADAAIFSAIAIWYFTRGHNTCIGISVLFCLASGSVVSYARAKAESLGLDIRGGVAERGERLTCILLATGLVGLGAPDTVLLVASLCLGIASVCTIGQRIHRVWRATQREAQDRRRSRC